MPYYYRALYHLILGLKFGPIPNAKKFLFPNSRQKKKNLSDFFFIFGGFFTNTEHIVTYLQFHRIIEYNHTYFFISLFS